MIVVHRIGDTALMVKGHAGSDLYGHDLICAAVSALVLALEANVQAMRRKGMLHRSWIHLEPGEGRIRCTPKEGKSGAAAEVFDTVCLGFEALAEKFGKYVVYLAQ